MKVIRETVIVISLFAWLCTAALSQDSSSEGRMEFILKNKHNFPHDSLVVLSKLLIQTGKIKDARKIHDDCFKRKKPKADDYKISAAAALWEATINKYESVFSSFGDRPLKDIDRVLDADALDAEALFLKGKYYELKKKPELAITWYIKTAQRCDTCYTYGFKPVWFELASLYEKLERNLEAAECFEKGAILLSQSGNTWPLITCAFNLLRLGVTDRFSEYFVNGLSNIPDNVLIDSLYSEADIIAGNEEKAEWDTLKTTHDKLEFLRRFWKSRDLDLTTNTNERLAEHYKRLFHARSIYYYAMRPWLDDRGKIYVRMGKPDRTHLGNMSQGNDGSIVFALNKNGTPGAREGKSEGGFDQVNVAAGINIYPNESWFYDTENLYFDFVNSNGFYELKPLTKSVGLGSAPTKFGFPAIVTTYMGLYLERNKHHPVYDRLLKKKLSELEISAEFEKNYENTKKQFFYPDYKKPHLPLSFSYSSYRDKNNFSSVDFFYIIPLSELSFIPEKDDMRKESASLKVLLSVYDHQFKEVHSKTYEMNILKELSFDQSNYFLDVRRIQLKPGTYHIGLRALSDTVKEGVYKARIVVPDYSSDQLQMSDVQTAFKIDDGMTADKYTKPGTAIRVLPNPGKMNNKSKPLYVYYEIYNLTLDADGKSRYQIEYKMLPDKSRETFVNTIKNIFTKQEGSIGSITAKEGLSAVSREYMAFDVSEVPEGASVLEITVTDLNTQRRSKKTTPLILENEK